MSVSNKTNYNKNRKILENNSGALACEARSGAPWVAKCGKQPIRENLVIT